jgi:hypothetical protein
MASSREAASITSKRGARARDGEEVLHFDVEQEAERKPRVAGRGRLEQLNDELRCDPPDLLGGRR